MWLTLASFSLGWGCLAIGGAYILFAFTVSVGMRCLTATKEHTSVLSMLSDIGQRILREPRLNVNRTATIRIRIKDLSGKSNYFYYSGFQANAVIPANALTVDDEPPTTNSPEEEVAVTGSSSIEINEDEYTPPVDLLIYWQKPLRLPHNPYFSVVLGPLISTSRPPVWQFLYALNLFISGTCSPHGGRYYPVSFSIAGLVGLSSILLAAGCVPKAQISGGLVIGITVVGFALHIIPATIRWYEPRFSYVYFHPIGEVVISGVIWLAGTLFAGVRSETGCGPLLPNA